MTKPDLEFSHTLFTDVFFKIRKARKRFVIIWGGASASKSYSMMQHVIIRTFEDPGTWLVIRKYSSDIYESVYEGLKSIIREWKLTGDFIFWKQPMAIVNKVTGSKIIFKGMDDPEKLKSIFNIKYIYIEEMNQLEFDDFRELNRRVRGIEGIQIYGLFNPIVITHWIKNEIFDKPVLSEACEFIHATYKDALRFLTQEDIANLEMLKDINPNDYKIYALGLWGAIRTGNEFYYNFSYARHVKECAYNPRVPIHISFDQNVVPYITMTIWQIEERHSIYYVNGLEEYCLTNPKNTTEALCWKLIEDYRDRLNSGLYYYGDATGRARDTRANETDYDIVEKVLKAYLHNSSCRVPYQNPLHVKKREFVNKIFSDRFAVRMCIDPGCKNLLTDLELIQEDAEGKKWKPVKREHGASFETLGHASDTMDYMLMSAFESFIEVF